MRFDTSIILIILPGAESSSDPGEETEKSGSRFRAYVAETVENRNSNEIGRTVPILGNFH